MEYPLWEQPLFRRWHSGWWDQDFSIEGLERRRRREAATKHPWPPTINDSLLTTLPKYELGGRTFSALHLPYYDSEGNKSARFEWGASEYELMHNSLQPYIARNTDSRLDLRGAIIDFSIFTDKSRSCRCPLWLDRALIYNVDLMRAYFQRSITVNDAYLDEVFLSESEVNEYISLERSIISGSNFSKSVLSSINARDAIFWKFSFFHRATFKGHKLFERCKFYGEVDFSSVKTEVADDAIEAASWHFNEAQFFGDISFLDTDFGAPTDFTGSSFRGIPNFHNSTWHQDTSFRDTSFGPYRSSFVDNIWFYIHHRDIDAKDTQEYEPDIDSLEDCFRLNREIVKMILIDESLDRPGSYPYWVRAAVARDYPWRVPQEYRDHHFGKLETAFRTMRLLAQQISLKPDEYRFYRLEMMARRRRRSLTDIPISERVTSFSYEMLSDFGQSILRPALIWVAISIACSILYCSLSSGSTDRFYLSIELSLTNMLKPMWFWATAKPAVTSEPNLNSWVYDTLSGLHPLARLGTLVFFSVQSALSLLLAFLFALALRRRFQVG